MQIHYFGHSYLFIKGKDYSIALDPYGDIGLKYVEVEADYVFSSHSHYDHNNFSLVKNAKLVKESEVFKIIKSYHDNSFGALRGENELLLFNLDGYKLAFLGDLGESCNDNLINELKGVDVLFIPVGGKYTIDSLEAFNYVEKIQPKTIIPIHYKIKGSNVDIKEVKDFLNMFDGFEIENSPYTYRGEEGVIVINHENKEVL